MNLKMFTESVRFNKGSQFSKKLKSPAGSVFSVSTRRNEPTIRISVESLAQGRAEERVLQIPLRKMHYTIGLSTVIPRPEPHAVIGDTGPDKGRFVVQLIGIGGPEPESETDQRNAKNVSEELYIELDAAAGDWHIEPDVAAELLNISFLGPKTTK